ncbi:unnamed protein product, partial [Brassica oleracea]
MILMFYFNFMYGVESRVPSNVNPNLAAGRGVPKVNITKTAFPLKDQSAHVYIICDGGNLKDLLPSQLYNK